MELTHARTCRLKRRKCMRSKETFISPLDSSHSRWAKGVLTPVCTTPMDTGNEYLFGLPFLHILQHFLKCPISCASDYCRHMLDPQCILHLRWKTAVKRHKNKEVQLVCSLLSRQILSIGYRARLIGGNFLLLKCRLVNQTQHKASFPSHLWSTSKFVSSNCIRMLWLYYSHYT